jgi:1-acyl-sn-glycerol-3-phosphate acyltransferase
MWLELSAISIGGFCIQLLLAAVTFPFDRKRYVVGRFYRLMGIAVAKISPFWKFEIVGDVTPPRGKTVVVSNHESQADPFLISFLPWEMKWLAKAALFKIPFIGWSMWLGGDIPIHRGVSESGQNAMGRCARWLSLQMPVMIFPEGTRSTTQDLLPFKDGAFRLALETGAEVLPIAVAGTRKALPKHSWRFQVSRALVAVGTPLSTEGMTLADLETLKARARDEILRLRAMLVQQLSAAG